MDEIYQVRTATATSIKKLCKHFGDDWTTSRFVPQLTTLWDKAESYVEKTVVMYAFRALAFVAKGDVLMEQLLPRVIEGCKDNTPNVKFISVQTLQELTPNLDDMTKKNQVIPLLEEMQRDPDSDVQYYSSICLDTL